MSTTQTTQIINVDKYKFKKNKKFVKKRDGLREEHVICNYHTKSLISKELKDISEEIISKFSVLQNKTLVYVSVIVAKKNADKNNIFHVHADSKTKNYYRSLTYLTDVPNINHGPIVFDNSPILGQKGTTVMYDSKQLHSGLPNISNIDRNALTMIFVDNKNILEYINCSETDCEEYCSGNECITHCTNCSCGNDINWGLVLTVFIVIGAAIIALYYIYQNNKNYFISTTYTPTNI